MNEAAKRIHGQPLERLSFIEYRKKMSDLSFVFESDFS